MHRLHALLPTLHHAVEEMQAKGAIDSRGVLQLLPLHGLPVHRTALLHCQEELPLRPLLAQLVLVAQCCPSCTRSFCEGLGCRNDSPSFASCPMTACRSCRCCPFPHSGICSAPAATCFCAPPPAWPPDSLLAGRKYRLSPWPAPDA